MIKDFTLNQYSQYLDLLIEKKIPFLTFKTYLRNLEKPSKFCLIRHDVDRKPKNALRMAELEFKKGVVSTYYFRIKKSVFNQEIIAKIASFGHEVGYHYESLSDTNGNVDLALIDFEINLKKIRSIVDIYTCSMHGRPLKKFDNRDIWKINNNHSLIKSKFNLLGEVYLDIDYTDIAYINDTGRNWTSSKSNRRDKVFSNIVVDFNNQKELIDYLRISQDKKIVFQIHPERWSDNLIDWYIQFLKDKFINILKRLLKK